MSIDWITVGAQVLNFLVLVWLLKRFLYRPILDGIDAREAEIATRMGEAAEVREAAETAEAEFKAEIAALRASRADMLEEARTAAEQERGAILAAARERLSIEQADRLTHQAEEAAAFSAELHRTGAAALVALTRKALLELADETLEQRMVAHAATRIKERASELRTAAGNSREAVVLTHDALSGAEQEALRREFASVLPEFDLAFETNQDISTGLSLRLGGAQVEWTLDSYLSGLDQALEDISERSRHGGLSYATS